VVLEIDDGGIDTGMGLWLEGTAESRTLGLSDASAASADSSAAEEDDGTRVMWLYVSRWLLRCLDVFAQRDEERSANIIETMIIRAQVRLIDSPEYE